MKNFKSAYTMIELVFVIVVIGILASVAIPKLAATRDDAHIAKAKTQVASVRNALSMERQKRILRGDFTAITAVGGTNTGVFGNVDDNSSDSAIFEYPVESKNANNHWEFKADTNEYIYHSNALGGEVKFQITNGKFVCVTPASTGCKQLTE